jgi:hypothetical protein
VVLLLAALAAAAVVAASAGSRPAADTVRWDADIADPTGATVVLGVESSAPFIRLFLYPDGNFAISGIDQSSCHTIVTPKGPGLGCSTGATTSFKVSFKTAPPIPGGTTAKLVLDNANEPGARALTVTLKSCAAQAKAFEDAKARYAAAYAAARRAADGLKRASVRLNQFAKLLGQIDASIKAGLLQDDGGITLQIIKSADSLRRQTEQAAQQATDRLADLKRAFDDRQAAAKALEECLNASPSRSVAGRAAVAACSIPTLIKRVHGIPVLDLRAKLRTIKNKLAHHQTAAARADLSRLRARVGTNAKLTAGIAAAVSGCAP